MSDLKQVAELRKEAASFQSLMAELEALRPVAKASPAALRDLTALLKRGDSIRTGIAHITRQLDAGNKWASRTFQTNALETIPFAENVVRAASSGSVSAIQHFQQDADAFRTRLKPLAEKVAGLSEAQQEILATMPEVLVEATPLPRFGLWPAVLLVCALGGLAFWYARERDPTYVED